MTKLVDMTVQELLATTASKKPAPGGGSISALMGAAAAALTAMVARLTAGRKGNRPGLDEEMEGIIEEAERIQVRFETLVDRDTEAYDGVQALEQVKQQIPDLIMLDVMMPRLNGWETLRALQSQEETAQIPVLMLTALKEPPDVKEGFDLGCTWFYTKPITDYDDLLLILRRILETTQPGEGE